MFRKSILLQIIIIMFTASCVHAQSTSNSDGVSLNIRLYPIQTILVNPSQSEVSLEYISKQDYLEGVVNEQENHITIYSTGGFEVSVESSEDYLVGINKNIEASDIKIMASRGSDNDLHNVNYISDVILSSSATGLFNSTSGGVNQSFNVTYEAAGNDRYINHFDTSSSNSSTYSTVITYSIVTR